MNFNTQGYERALADMIEKVKADTETDWRATIELRYAQFCLRQASRMLKSVADGMPGAWDGPYRERAVAGAMAGLAHINTLVASSTAILNGMTQLKMPERAEATLRLYEQAASPPLAPEEKPHV